MCVCVCVCVRVCVRVDCVWVLAAYFSSFSTSLLLWLVCYYKSTHVIPRTLVDVHDNKVCVTPEKISATLYNAVSGLLAVNMYMYMYMYRCLRN